MSRYISPEVRREIAIRADFLCEYCLIAQEDTYFGCEVEHIISLKHGGSPELENLAYACSFCNRHKGSDIGSVSESGEFSRFFNPRTDQWADHFRLGIETLMPLGIEIQALTQIARATVQVLGLNEEMRQMLRYELWVETIYTGSG